MHNVLLNGKMHDGMRLTQKDLKLWTTAVSHKTTNFAKRIYNTIEEINVDSKAECDQLNLAHVARNKKV